MQGDKIMDHAKYQRQLKDKSVESLRFIIRDCREAIQANPENPNNGYYTDEIHYVYAEIKRRLINKSLVFKGDKFFELMNQPNEELAS